MSKERKGKQTLSKERKGEQAAQSCWKSWSVRARALCANLAEMHFDREKNLQINVDREKICNCILIFDIWSSCSFSIGKKCNYKWRESFEKRWTWTKIVWTVYFKCYRNSFQGSSEEKEAKRLLQKQLSDERRVSDLKHQWYFTDARLKKK